MPISSDNDDNIGNGPLAKGRDPKAKSKTVGTMAVTDAVLIVVAAWAVLFFLSYSLRHHNV